MVTPKLMPLIVRHWRILAKTHASISASIDPILITESKHSAIITLNRPNVLNALNKEIITQLDSNLEEFERTKLCVILNGSGGKSFSVGGDVSALLKVGLEGSQTFFRSVYTFFYFLSKCKIPIISLIDGATMGGGYGLAVYGKYRVATERTVFAMPEIAIGLFPDVGSSFFLNKLSGKLGLYLGLTGNRLMAEDVTRVGLATHFSNSSQLTDLVSELTNVTDSNEVSTILDNFCLKVPRNQGTDVLMDKINTCFDAGTMEEILTNLERDGSEWGLNTLRILEKKCPLSLKLTFKQMQLGASKPLDECLKMEYRMAFRRLGDSDFREGVRAVLVDKDNKPAWNPSKLDAVTDDLIEKYFEKLPDSEELKL